MATGRQKFRFDAINKERENAPVEENKSSEENVTQVENLVNRINNPVRENNFEVKIVPRKKIRLNKKNTYSSDIVKQMEDSILHIGLQQNLCCIYSMEEDMYIVETGHKRTIAIDNLIDLYSNWDGDIEDENYQLYLKNVSCFEKGYPVKTSAVLDESILYDEVEDENLTEMPIEVIDSEIRLHNTNLITTIENSAERTRHVQRLASLMEEKNRRAKKKADKININKTIGTQLGVTSRQIANMISVKKLIPELQEEFDNNNISLKNATGYANLSEEEQRIILDLIRAGKKVSKEEVALLKKEMAQEKFSMEEELREKERELERLKEELQHQNEGNVDVEQVTKEHQKELEKKNEYIKQLERDVKIMQAATQKSEAKRDLDKDEISLLKNSLALKNSLKTCEKEISHLYVTTNIFKDSQKKIKTTKQSELDIVEKEELLKGLQELEKVIDNIRKKLEE